MYVKRSGREEKGRSEKVKQEQEKWEKNQAYPVQDCFQQKEINVLAEWRWRGGRSLKFSIAILGCLFQLPQYPLSGKISTLVPIWLALLGKEKKKQLNETKNIQVSRGF